MILTDGVSCVDFDRRRRANQGLLLPTHTHRADRCCPLCVPCGPARRSARYAGIYLGWSRCGDAPASAAPCVWWVGWHTQTLANTVFLEGCTSLSCLCMHTAACISVHMKHTTDECTEFSAVMSCFYTECSHCCACPGVRGKYAGHQHIQGEQHEGGADPPSFAAVRIRTGCRSCWLCTDSYIAHN